MAILKVNDICYIIENWNRVSKVEIIAIRGKFYIVKFLEKSSPSAASLRRSRLYLTEEEARQEINEKPNIKKQDLTKFGGYNKPHWPCIINKK